MSAEDESRRRAQECGSAEERSRRRAQECGSAVESPALALSTGDEVGRGDWVVTMSNSGTQSRAAHGDDSDSMQQRLDAQYARIQELRKIQAETSAMIAQLERWKPSITESRLKQASRTKQSTSQGPRWTYAEHKYDVCEVFSPPRVAPQATAMGFKGGWSLDRSCEDHTSQRRFDFLQKQDREMAKRMLRRDRP